MSRCLPCEQIKRGITKVSNISEAWVNVVIPNPEVELLASNRNLICNSCSSQVEFMKINGNSVFKCKECSCPIIALIRSNEKCKLNKW